MGCGQHMPTLQADVDALLEGFGSSQDVKEKCSLVLPSLQLRDAETHEVLQCIKWIQMELIDYSSAKKLILIRLVIGLSVEGFVFCDLRDVLTHLWKSFGLLVLVGLWKQLIAAGLRNMDWRWNKMIRAHLSRIYLPSTKLQYARLFWKPQDIAVELYVCRSYATQPHRSSSSTF